MAERKVYYIQVDGTVVEVTKAVYHMYYKMERRERHLEEKDQKHSLVSYHALDTEDVLGEEMLSTPDIACVEVVTTENYFVNKNLFSSNSGLSLK